MNDTTKTRGKEMSEWRIIPFAPLYEVSDEGSVRRSVGGVSTFAGRQLKPWQEDNGYWRVMLRIDGKSEKHWIQRLVLFAFVGPPPSPEHESAHGDGDPSNNRLGNLRWATPTENSYDSIKHGTKCEGEKSPLAVLTVSEVREMRVRYTGAWGQVAALAHEFGIARGHAWRVIHRQIWIREVTK